MFVYTFPSTDMTMHNVANSFQNTDCHSRNVANFLQKISLDSSVDLLAVTKNKVTNKNTGHYHELLITVAWFADFQEDLEMH